MAEIQKIGNVYYRVRDMDAAVSFYRDVLGLTLKFRDADNWTAFDVAGVTFALEGAPSVQSGGGATVSFRVQDLPGMAVDLSNRGASVGEIETGAHERTLTLQDPSGNTIRMYEPMPA